MRTLELAGVNVPVIGQGTWRMGEDPSRHTRKSPPCAWASSWA